MYLLEWQTESNDKGHYLLKSCPKDVVVRKFMESQFPEEFEEAEDPTIFWEIKEIKFTEIK